MSKKGMETMLELLQWFANEKLIEATEAYEAGDKSAYREMNRIEEMINTVKSEALAIKTGRRF